MHFSEQKNSTASPAELVAGILAGDRRAEDDLVLRYRRGIDVILRRTLQSSDVDDLAQEVFLRAIAKVRAGEVHEPEKLSGFLCGLARNLAIGHLRKTQAAEAAETNVEFADPADGPLAQVLRQEGRQTVNRVLEELSSRRDREVLIRYYLAEDPKESICRDLAITSLHFNRVLFRARERFRQLYIHQEVGRRPG